MLGRKGPSGPNIDLQPFPASSASPNSGASKTIDWTEGPVQRLRQTAACTITQAGLPAGESVPKLTLIVTQGPGAPYDGGLLIQGAKTPGGQGLSLSTTPGAVDEIEITWDGFVAYARVVGLEYGP